MAHQLLLADDSVTIQRVIKLTFAGEDVDVIAVGDGDQAVASINRLPPDIVLADVAMPGRTGYDVAEHIRASPKLAHIPVLLLTGAFEAVDEARVSALGCDGVLAKPFDPGAVVARVKELLARPRRAAGGSTAVQANVAAASAVSAVSAGAGGSVATAAKADRPRPDIDAYFERLDKAFADLASSPRPAAPTPSEATASDSTVSGGAIPALVGTALTPAPPPAGPAAPASTAVAAPSAPVPAAAPVAANDAALPISEAQVQQIVDRVLDALAARLRVPVAEVVATVAERVVREQIAEIKRRV